MQYDKEFGGDLFDLALSKLPNGEVKIPSKQIYLCLALSDIRLERLEIVNAIKESEKPALEVFNPENYDRLVSEKIERIKELGSDIARKLRERWGYDCIFVPFEHFDPVKNKEATPDEIYGFESNQIKRKTNLLIVIADDPSWGGGMEVGWCDILSIPIIIINTQGRYISRLMRGSALIARQVEYRDREDAVSQVEIFAAEILGNSAFSKG